MTFRRSRYNGHVVRGGSYKWGSRVTPTIRTKYKYETDVRQPKKRKGY